MKSIVAFEHACGEFDVSTQGGSSWSSTSTLRQNATPKLVSLGSLRRKWSKLWETVAASRRNRCVIIVQHYSISLRCEGKIEDFHHRTTGLSPFASPLAAVCSSLRPCLWVPYQYIWRWHRNGPIKCRREPAYQQHRCCRLLCQALNFLLVRLSSPSCYSPLQTRYALQTSPRTESPKLPSHTTPAPAVLPQEVHQHLLYHMSKPILSGKCSSRIARSVSAIIGS
jgi:hypothetical protein